MADQGCLSDKVGIICRCIAFQSPGPGARYTGNGERLTKMKRRCWGWTKQLNRCQRNVDDGLYCHLHKRQPIVIVFVLITTVGSTIFQYIDYFHKPEQYYNSLYTRALSGHFEKKHNESVTLFREIYDYNPSYPDVAFHLGEDLAQLGKYEEALIVWRSVPSTENHIIINYFKGLSSYLSKKYKPAIKYFDEYIQTTNSDDKYYWIARGFSLYSKNIDTDGDKFLNDVLIFTDITRNEIENILEISTRKGTTFEIDTKTICTKCSSREVVSFYLLRRLAARLNKEGKFDIALKIALKAIDFLPGPFDTGYMSISQCEYADFLKVLSNILSLCWEYAWY